MSEPTADELNRILRYVQDNLPEGWTIEMDLDCDGWSISLYDQHCNEADVDWGAFPNECTVVSMCDYAKEHEQL